MRRPPSAPVMLAAALAVLAAHAAVAHDHDQARSGAKAVNPAFEKLKSLEGTWTGKAGVKGGEASDATVIYKLTGAGTALVETLFAGTPHEMVTVYYPDGTDVRLTHYCAAGNQPTMKLTGADGKTLRFEFVSGTNMKLTDMHMHSMSVTLLDPDHIQAEWTSWREGKAAEVAAFDLTRKS